MEFKDMNLSQLSLLWQASDGNLAIRQAVERELVSRRAGDTRFSIEYFYKVAKRQNHAINVTFIPATEAYLAYGEHITIDMLIDNADALTLLQHMQENPPINTYGYIKAKSLISNELNVEQAERLADKGFHTADVLEVLHM